MAKGKPKCKKTDEMDEMHKSMKKKKMPHKKGH